MANILLIDFGSTFTKITAVDIEREVVIGTARAMTTVQRDITEGFNAALSSLYKSTGKLDFGKVLGCSSAAGGLKMIAVGLVPELTAEAARQAALGAGAKVLGVYSHELNEYELADIAALSPDILLLAGGTDGGNKTVIRHNAKMLANLSATIPVVLAGNKSVAHSVAGILKANGREVYHSANVMPRLDELNVEPARQAIREVFLKRIVQAKGLDKANKVVDRMVMPTPAAVLRAAELLSLGINGEQGWGNLMVIDIGGATTDVYSIATGDPTKGGVMVKGLPEPLAKRTVEGDLGMRYSVGPLLQAATAETVAGYAKSSSQQVLDYVVKVQQDVDYLPQGAEEQLELALGRACTKLSVDRHVGRLESYFSPHGAAFVQYGKDLTAVPVVIGTGGVIVNSNKPEEILRGVLFDPEQPELLKPKKPAFYIDNHYIMAAMGLLGEEYPDKAIRIMRKYIVGRDLDGTKKSPVDP
jgi:uncharacterized protein (TIGR01319 family)